MGVYDRGRPNKVGYDGIKDIPHGAGEYRIKDDANKHKYTGETNDLRRRAKEHRKVVNLGRLISSNSWLPTHRHHKKEENMRDDRLKSINHI